jgi:PAS domain S-box-containing protein
MNGSTVHLAVSRGLVAVLVLGLMIVLVRQARSFDPGLYNRIDQTLTALRATDAELDEAVLKLRYRLHNNYDVLVAQLGRLKRLTAELAEGPYSLARLRHPLLDRELERLQGALQSKEVRLEHFKSHNALLRNTLLYLPRALEEVISLTPIRSQLHMELHEVMHELNRVQVNLSQVDLIALDKRLTAIEGTRTYGQPALEDALRRFSFHARNVIRYSQEMDELIPSIVSEPGVALGDALNRAFRRVFRESLQSSNVYRLALFLVALLLFAYTAFTLYRLRDRSHKLAEALHSLEFQKFAMDQHAIVSITDVRGDITYANDRFCEISGYKREELIGRNHRIVKSDEHPEEFYREMWRTIASGQVWHGEIKNSTKDGGFYWVAATIVPFLDTSGKPYQYVSIRTDITRQKRLEEQLERERAFLANITDHMGEGVYAVDEQGRCTFLNREAERLLGWEREELAGHDLNAVIHFGQRPLLPEENYRSNDETFTRRDGSQFDVALVTAPLMKEGQVIGSVGVFRDITEEKRSARQLQAALEAARAASEAKSHFLANMSHEIRTPMNGIIGMTELALDTDLSREQAEYLGIIRSSAESLLTIINDILDFSRIEAGELNLVSVEFDLREVVGETAKTLAYRAQEKGLELVVDVAADVPERLRGDPGRLRQVLINLLGNAVKFTERGSVVLRLSSEGSEQGRARLHFSVEDTGIGIPKDKQESIFASFAQADATITREYGGTGLGLAISNRLVELMGGRIGVESEPGVGSSFYFDAWFDLVREARPRTPCADLAGRDALLVCAHAISRDVIGRQLGVCGLQVQAVASPAEALQQPAHEWRVVMIDLGSVGEEGLQLARQLIDEGLPPGDFVLLTTANGLHEAIGQAGVMGIQTCLTKPVIESELQAALNGLVQQHRHVRGGDRGQPAGDAGGVRLLLVEDNPVNRKVALSLLEKQGYTVQHAGNGLEALEILQRENFDLVLMDVQMPVMDGYEATRRIRQREAREGGHLPIIAMTASAMQEDRDRCMQAGMDDYISKPFNKEELFRVIRAYTA